MSLTVKGSVQGIHNTPVSLTSFVSIIEQQLSGIKANAELELQVRPVHIQKYNRCGIYAVGYDIHAPNSIELLLFNGEVTGRPATLCVKDTQLMGRVLQNLSTRLHNSWEQNSKRTYGAPTTFVSSASTRDSKSPKPIDNIKTVITLTKNILRKSPEFMAYNYLTSVRSGKTITSQVILHFLGCTDPDSVLISPILHVHEQFGLINLYNYGKGGISATLTDYCTLLANEWVLEVNTKAQAEWGAQGERLHRSTIQSKEILDSYLQKAANQQKQVSSKVELYKKHLSSQPKMLALIRDTTSPVVLEDELTVHSDQ